MYPVEKVILTFSPVDLQIKGLNTKSSPISVSLLQFSRTLSVWSFGIKWKDGKSYKLSSPEEIYQYVLDTVMAGQPEEKKAVILKWKTAPLNKMELLYTLGSSPQVFTMSLLQDEGKRAVLQAKETRELIKTCNDEISKIMQRYIAASTDEESNALLSEFKRLMENPAAFKPGETPQPVKAAPRPEVSKPVEVKVDVPKPEVPKPVEIKVEQKPVVEASKAPKVVAPVEPPKAPKAEMPKAVEATKVEVIKAPEDSKKRKASTTKESEDSGEKRHKSFTFYDGSLGFVPNPAGR